MKMASGSGEEDENVKILRQQRTNSDQKSSLEPPVVLEKKMKMWKVYDNNGQIMIRKANKKFLFKIELM